MARLFVVATPIGNLEDLTPRARRVLGEVTLIAAEDTRSARVLLGGRSGGAKLISYNEHNRDQRIPEILAYLETGDVALISDAGTPAISDPGAELVAAARAAGHEVVALPGASAPIAALSVAGLRARSFLFLGFLPRSQGPLRRLFEERSHLADALVALESPARLRRTLAVLAAALPERRLAVCRELTKLHEEVFVGTAAAVLSHFPAPRGEIVLVIEGTPAEPPPAVADEAALQEEVAAMRALGLSQRQAEALLGRRFKLPRRRLYELWLAAAPRA